MINYCIRLFLFLFYITFSPVTRTQTIKNLLEINSLNITIDYTPEFLFPRCPIHRGSSCVSHVNKFHILYIFCFLYISFPLSQSRGDSSEILWSHVSKRKKQTETSNQQQEWTQWTSSPMPSEILTLHPAHSPLYSCVTEQEKKEKLRPSHTENRTQTVLSKHNKVN